MTGFGDQRAFSEKGYPFSAVLGAQGMRLALLPAIDVVASCRFGCDPAAPEPHCPDGRHDTGPHGQRGIEW
jgi:Mg-chelatase subunit ChlI